MIAKTVVAELVAKGFRMAGTAPTYHELVDALKPYEHNCFRDAAANQYRGSIKLTQSNKTITTTVADTDCDSVMARLWLSVN